jgi:hypothetical protein
MLPITHKLRPAIDIDGRSASTVVAHITIKKSFPALSYSVTVPTGLRLPANTVCDYPREI